VAPGASRTGTRSPLPDAARGRARARRSDASPRCGAAGVTAALHFQAGRGQGPVPARGGL
jgi:hypothetical protein